MMKRFVFQGILPLAALMGTVAGTVPSAKAQSTAPVRMVVTAEARHGKEVPPVTQSDVKVTSGKESLRVLDWARAENASLQVLLLMDESLNSNIGTQFSDLKKFITGLPAQSQVGIGYMRNGTVQYAQEFTTDHASAATKLRLPLGNPGATSSPYFSLSELFKNWQSNGGRRTILMISDGIERYGSFGPNNPYVLSAIAQAQRGGVSVSSIFWGGEGHFGRSYYRMNWGENYLSEMADATGGEAYWEGFGNPVSFAPYLEDFRNRLDHQYVLTIQTEAKKKSGLVPVRLATELSNVELIGPSQVEVPAR